MQNMLKHSMHVLYVDNQRLGLILWQELIYSQVNYKLAVDAENFVNNAQILRYITYVESMPIMLIFFIIANMIV